MRLRILIRSSRRTFLIFFALLASFFAGGEQSDSRSFDRLEMKLYSEMDDFSYMNLTVRPPSIWQRLQWWFANLVSKIFSNPNSPWLSNVIFYGLLFFVLGLAIFYILRLRYVSAVSSESKYSGTPGIASLSVAKTQDFDKLIEEARKNQEFKLAIRYLYLKSLHFLAINDLIKLKDWKSPFDYKQELQKELVPAYADLSELFEFVWYGDFDAGEKELKKGSELLVELERNAK